MKNRYSIGRNMGVRRPGAPLLLATILILLSLGCAASAMAANDLLLLPAAKSRLASASILMDVTNTGKRLVAVGERGHILLSDNQGKSWSQAEVPVSVTLTAVYFPTAEKGWAVGHDGVVLHSVDGGQSWFKDLDGTQINESIQLQVDQMLQIKEAALASAETPEQEELLQQELENLNFFANDAQMAIEEGATRPFMDLWFKNEREGIIVGSFGMILRTVDGGKEWLPILDRIENFDGYHYYAIAPVGDALFIVGERGMLFRSTDDGNSWQRLDTPYEGTFFGVSGSDDGRLVIVFGLRGNAFTSIDGGNSWQPANTPKGAALSDATFLADGSLMMIANDGSLIRSSDGGQSFQPLSTRFPGGISMAEVNSDTIVATGAFGLKIITLKN